MHKLLSGVVAALVMCVLGLCGANTGVAQEKVKTLETMNKFLNTQEMRVCESVSPAVVLTAEVATPGTWTVVDTKAGTMLLNTVNGETFVLRNAETSPRWVKVERPERETWRLETVPRPERVIPVEPHSRRGSDEGRQGNVRDQIALLERGAEALRAKWAASGDREQRRKFAEELERIEEKLEKLKAEARESEGPKSRR